jgi:hypothetical protein
MFGAESLVKPWQPTTNALPDAEGCDLNGKNICVFIHDQTAEAIAVGMNDAPGL